MFDPYLTKLNNSIISHGGESVNVPHCFAENHSEIRNCSIKSWLWNVPGFRRWRVTRLDAGLSLQVLNSVAYPIYENEQPLMGIDCLWFGTKKKLVAILDFQPLIQDKNYLNHYFDDLRNLKEQFSKFCNHHNMRLYDSNKYFSPWVLFCRGGEEHAKEELPLVFDSFLDSYWNLGAISKNRYLKLEPEEIKNLHISYDIYSADRDPAHKLFTNYFGKEWSEEFLRKFLFPESLHSKLLQTEDS